MKIRMGVLAVAAALILSGCFELPSVYPLYTTQTAVAEPRLVGAWQTKDGKDQLFVKVTGDREYRLTYVDDKGEGTVWEVRLVKLGATLVADLMATKDDAGIPAHHFMAVSLDGGVLRTWFLDSEKLRGKAGEAGLVYADGEKKETVLTAPTAALAAFLQENLAEETKRDPDLEALPLK
jgi:hypothetical protein